MFSIEQIKKAHGKVKSGADFPMYIHELKLLGVVSYSTEVLDGHNEYIDINATKLENAPSYEPLVIADECIKEQFLADLKNHQEGKTDYYQFCKDCAKSGIGKWIVNVNQMTCTYYDAMQNVVLIEAIPG